jgi:uncharacterized protein (TIGR00369 family)
MNAPLPPSDARADVPPGFVPIPLGDGYIGVNGPLYGKRDGDHMLLGFRVEARHCNPMGIAHGGMMMTFADMQLPIASRLQAGLGDHFLPTIAMTCDFVGPSPLGAWVEGRTDVLKVTRNLVFAQCLVTADGKPALRASGTFKLASDRKAPPLSYALIFGPDEGR